MYGANKIDSRIKEDDDFKKKIENIINNIKN